MKAAKKKMANGQWRMKILTGVMAEKQ